MDVAIGAGSDPKDRPGLAHFLEHMLFLGTEKYPQPDDYSSFIQQHGGSNNAYTTFANTNYFFEIDNEQLEPALDRFAQFFIAPLFSKTLVEREKNAVHSEFTGKRREDGLRFWSVRKKGLNPAHPMTGFTTGNLDTLADRPGADIRDELIDFYNQHYSSNIMSLALAGNYPLETMEIWVRQKFSSIKNQNTTRQKFNIPLFTDDQLTTRLNVTPLTDQRFMLLTFPLPKIAEHQFTRPRSYIGNVIGHEGPGSLLSELKRQGWVTGLSAGGSTQTRAADTFDISIGLTADGVDHVDDIIENVFASINRLKQSGLPQWLFDENQLIDELSFRYQEKAPVSRLVRALSVRAQDWPAQKLLSGPYRRTRFDTEGVRMILDKLQPDNMQLIVAAPELPTDRTTKWYDTPYSIITLSEDRLKRWQNAGVNPRIEMPAPNRFLPQDLTLRADGRGDPIKLIDTPRLQVWHRTDSSFGVPRANFRVNLHLPNATRSARASVLTEIFAQLVNEQLSEFSYAANLAGLGAGLSTNSRGLSLNMSGYADGQRKMLESVVDAMQNLKFDQTLFTQIKRELKEEITNNTQDAPYKQTANRTYQLLYSPYFTEQQRLSAIESIERPDIKRFADKLFNELRVVALSHGNLTGKETLEHVEILRQSLTKQAQPASVKRIHMVELPAGNNYAHELSVNHADNAISVYMQSTQRDRATRARYAVLRQLLSQPAYNELRTTQQLGYFVFTYTIDLIQVPSVVIAIQSPATAPGALYTAIEQFLQDFETDLLAMSDDAFQANVQAVVARVEEPETRLSHRTSRYWSAIIREDYRFDASALFAEALRSVSKQDILDLYSKLFVEKENGRLVVYSNGTSKGSETDTIPNPLKSMQPIASLETFKKDKNLLPPLSEVPGVE